MEALMSNWPNPVQSMPEKYIFPPHSRPGTHVFPVINDVPTIDLGGQHSHNRAHIIQQIFQASREFGFFQVINHGIPLSLMEETMKVVEEFFTRTAAEYKASLYSTELNKKCRLYSSTLNYDHEEFHFWRDNLTHHCHPLHDHIHLWPQRPPTYREVVGAYTLETRKLAMRILELISQSLGLKPTYFENEISKTQLLSMNHHIPCPDPSLTLGMPQHSDPNLLTMLQQCSVPGFQVLRHGQWMTVQPTTGAFIVLAGLQLKVISNGEFSSPIHRVVTHSGEARTTIGTFLIPSNEIRIEPAAGNDPAVYRGFTYSEFFTCFVGNNSDADVTLQSFKNHTI